MTKTFDKINRRVSGLISGLHYLYVKEEGQSSEKLTNGQTFLEDLNVL